jgi:PAS domain S-box-containing protein
VTRSERDDFRVNDAVLAESNALLAAIVRSASDAIIAIDRAGTILSWNFGAELLFGYREGEMIGRPIHRFVPLDRRKEQRSALSRIMAGEMVASFATVRTNMANQEVPVSITMSPIYDNGGSIIGASGILRARKTGRRVRGDDGQGTLWADRANDPAARPRRRNILVVEDEALIGLGLTTMLENAGFDVIGPAGDLRTAMELLDRNLCSLALLDINLGQGETSAPLAHRLQREGIPFFVTSAYLSSDQPEIFVRAPAFPKPVGARKLMAAVQELMAAQEEEEEEEIED